MWIGKYRKQGFLQCTQGQQEARSPGQMSSLTHSVLTECKCVILGRSLHVGVYSSACCLTSWLLRRYLVLHNRMNMKTTQSCWQLAESIVWQLVYFQYLDFTVPQCEAEEKFNLMIFSSSLHLLTWSFYTNVTYQSEMLLVFWLKHPLLPHASNITSSMGNTHKFGVLWFCSTQQKMAWRDFLMNEWWQLASLNTIS